MGVKQKIIDYMYDPLNNQITDIFYNDEIIGSCLI
jgi:hypothetical protein